MNSQQYLLRLRRRSHGFSLVELITILAIVGILSSFSIAFSFNIRSKPLIVEQLNLARALYRQINEYTKTHGKLPIATTGAESEFSSAAFNPNPATAIAGIRIPWENIEPWKSIDFRPEGNPYARFSIDAVHDASTQTGAMTIYVIGAPIIGGPTLYEYFFDWTAQGWTPSTTLPSVKINPNGGSELLLPEEYL